MPRFPASKSLLIIRSTILRSDLADQLFEGLVRSDLDGFYHSPANVDVEHEAFLTLSAVSLELLVDVVNSPLFALPIAFPVIDVFGVPPLLEQVVVLLLLSCGR